MKIERSRASFFLALAAVVTLLGNASESFAEDSSADRPNIVVILCDDLGYGDLACYGHPHIKTPHLDRLAATGIRLTACYSAAPVCSPSRVGLLTGRSPNRAGVYDWIPDARGTRPDARDQVHMREKEVTISRLLQAANYAACQVGKWHCNSHFNSSKQPQPGDFGFDHWFATQNNAAPSHEDPVNFVRNGAPVGRLEGYSCQLVVDEAISWLENQHRSQPEQPFFLFTAFHEPHEPVASPADLVAKYRSVAKSEDEAQYFANVENLDRATGRLLDALKRLGKRENTLVVFTSDNGPETLNRYRRANRSYGSPGPLRGMKLWTTEAGFRVAGIMNWPRVIKKPAVIAEPVSSLDFLPTFCYLAGITTPAHVKFDGADFRPIFSGEPIARAKPLFWCYFNAINEHRVVMRDGQWKLLAKLNRGKLPKFQNIHDKNIQAVRGAELTDFELYKITDDIGEEKNVIENHPQVAETLKVVLENLYHELAETSQVWQTQNTSGPR